MWLSNNSPTMKRIAIPGRTFGVLKLQISAISIPPHPKNRLPPPNRLEACSRTTNKRKAAWNYQHRQLKLLSRNALSRVDLRSAR